MYKVPEWLLKQIVQNLNSSNELLNWGLQEEKVQIEENNKTIRLIKDNYLLDGE